MSRFYVPGELEGGWELLATMALSTPQTLTSLLSTQDYRLWGQEAWLVRRRAEAGVLGAPSATQGPKH